MEATTDDQDLHQPRDAHPHKPTPLVVTDAEDLLLRDSRTIGREKRAVVERTDRPLYHLLMEVLHEGDGHCPDLMPAALADHCEDLVEVRDTVMSYDRGHVNLDGYASYGISYCHNVRDAIADWRERDAMRFVVVGCSGSKRDVDDAVAAKDLYDSTYWACKRDYAETLSDDWRILSAKHGLLHPSDEIAPYNRTPDDLAGVPVHADFWDRLPDGRPVETLLDQWALDVYVSLTRWLMFEAYHGSVDPADVELEFLLGQRYREPLEERAVFDRLRARGALSVSFPFQEEEQAQGGNGNQMGWMTDQVEAAMQAVTDGGATDVE